MLTQSSNTILLATDQQQSILTALDTTKQRRIAYTPYGHRQGENGLLSLLGFNGQLPDPLTGHYHLGKGYRQFNPVLIRFNSPDSWSPFGRGGLNAYAYCAGNPVNWKDPTGHSLVPARFFDEIFSNFYLTMKSSKSEHFSNTVISTENNFGGYEKVKMLAKNRNTAPDAFIANILSEKRPSSFSMEFPSDVTSGRNYLSKAELYLRDTLDGIITNSGLLNPNNQFYKHLDETQIRNLKTDLFTYKRELSRVISHVSSLRIEEPSRMLGFSAEGFVDAARKIRDSR